MKQLLSLLIFVISSTTALTQQTNWSVEGKWRSGFLLAHRGVMGHLATQHAHGIELIAIKRASGKKAWHGAYGHPDFNFHLYYGGVGNVKVLGNYLSLYSTMSYPLFQNNHWRLNLQVGGGLGFTNKIYDPILNPKNVAMASRIFAIMNVGVQAKYTFDKNTIGLGLDLMHFSNGGSKLPNLGLNLPYLNVSYARSINQQNAVAPDQVKAFQQRRFFYGISAIGSMKQVYPTGSKIYPVFALNLHARSILKPKMGWELALDIISKQSLIGYRPDIDKTQWRMLQIGVYAGYILPLDRFHYHFGVGTYLKDYYKADEPIYIKIGGRYYFDNGLHWQFALKTHYGKADYIEVGIGYSFNYSRNEK